MVFEFGKSFTLVPWTKAKPNWHMSASVTPQPLGPTEHGGIPHIDEARFVHDNGLLQPLKLPKHRSMLPLDKRNGGGKSGIVVIMVRRLAT